MSGAPDPVYVRARTALLDAADALVEQLHAVVLVGAQAIYLHAGDADKDALDVLRLLRVTDTTTLAAGLVHLATHEISAAVATEAVSQLAPLFGTPEAAGIAMAARAARPSAEADVISASFVALVSDLLTATGGRIGTQSPFPGAAT